jgi:hypothetical protein
MAELVGMNAVVDNMVAYVLKSEGGYVGLQMMGMCRVIV